MLIQDDRDVSLEVRGPEAGVPTLKQMLYRLVFTVVITCVLIGNPCTDPQQGRIAMASDMFDLFTAEDLTTVTIDQTVYFNTPDGGDAIVTPGIYRILLDEQSGLRFVPIRRNKETLLVQAVKTSHRDTVPSPVAVYLPDETNIPHIVLLLPGGKGLEAVGSFSGVRTRGTGLKLLSNEQLHGAVLEKLRKTMKENPK
jgi:hypothetical protein